MELFESATASASQPPLAARMRPRTLEEFSGQENIIEKGRLLYRAIKADRLASLIFFGPPGTGKTTLAAIIANSTDSQFITINAVFAGIKEIREAVRQAQEAKNLYARRTILFVDEVHRWNKAQQDALLPWIENGTIILIGATTENPFFEVNKALVSRSRIFRLEPLKPEHLYCIARQALTDKERGYGKFNIKIEEQALAHLVDVANGDARSLLNALELAVLSTEPQNSEISIDLQTAEQSIQKRAVLYDKEGDYHYDTISAFIKSLRGSDPDAALYWLAKMVYAGEDPRFIFRRMLIFACEDIGMADPQALIVCQAAAAAFEMVGLPEGQFHLAHAVIYLANAVKSNSVLGYFDALKQVEQESRSEVPKHLKDASRDNDSFGHGSGYRYPHAFQDHWVAQQYMPAGLQGKIFYQPGELGYEKSIQAVLEKRRMLQLTVYYNSEQTDIFAFAERDRKSTGWLSRVLNQDSEYFLKIHGLLFEQLSLRAQDKALDLNGDLSFITAELLKTIRAGGVWTLVSGEKSYFMEVFYPELQKRLEEVVRPVIISDNTVLKQEEYAAFFDVILGYGFLAENTAERLALLKRLLKSRGRIRLVEPLPRESQRLSMYLPVEGFALRERFREFEDSLYNAYPQVPVEKLRSLCVGFKLVTFESNRLNFKRKLHSGDLESWFFADSFYAEKLKKYFNNEEINSIYTTLKSTLTSDWLIWNRQVLLLVLEREANG